MTRHRMAALMLGTALAPLPALSQPILLDEITLTAEGEAPARIAPSADQIEDARTGTIEESDNLITAGLPHNLTTNDRVTFYTLTGGTGLTTGVAYYVIASGLSATEFRVSATQGGSAVNITVDYSAAAWVESTTYSGTWDNRGTYLGTFNALMVVGSGAGSIVATVGDSTFTITVPASTGDRTIRVKGTDKMLSFEEDDVETLQMSRIAFTNDTTWPMIDPGETPYSIVFHGMAGVGSGGSMWFYEQYA